jgi:hypothetical protein
VTGEHWRVPPTTTAAPAAPPAMTGVRWENSTQPIWLGDVLDAVTALSEQVRRITGAAGQIDAWAEVGRLRLLCERKGICPDCGEPLDVQGCGHRAGES